MDVAASVAEDLKSDHTAVKPLLSALGNPHFQCLPCYCILKHPSAASGAFLRLACIVSSLLWLPASRAACQI